MYSKRGIWFTVDLNHPLSIEEKVNLMDSVSYWDYGTFLIIRTVALHTCNQIHDLLDGILDESPLAVCIAVDVMSILDRLEVHFNSIQD